MAAYDVIIVGAGSAGARLAAGLSGDATTSVLLLEAGPVHGTAASARGASLDEFLQGGHGARAHLAGPRCDAAGRSVRGVYVRGRGAGGSSSVNAMCAIRATVDDYERWAGELGCRGWGWPEMLEAFLRVEDDSTTEATDTTASAARSAVARPICRAVAARCGIADGDARLGYPACDDYHAPDATGVSRVALTVRDGRRVSTNDAYLEPARARGNLDVRGDALVDRVLFDGRRRSAYGLRRRGDRRRAR